MTDTSLKGCILSATTIRVLGRAHAADAPFTLILVRLDDGRRVLGHFRGDAAPRIDSQVAATLSESGTLVFLERGTP